MIINPGQQASIRLEFTMHEGMDGPHDFRMSLKTNDPMTPITELIVLTDWIP
jgi:hypothetical protein